MPRAGEYGVFIDLNYERRGPSPGSSTPWTPWLALIGFVGLCVLVGAANGAITATSLRTWYLSLTPPPGTPPNWVFGPVWTSLNILVGVAAWMIWRRPDHRRALLLWGWQLLANAAWSPAFFAVHSPGLALAVLVTLLALIACTIRAFARIRPAAARLMVPYLLWTCYATYLNVGFWWLNPA